MDSKKNQAVLAVLLVHPKDNCVIATRALAAGETVLIDGQPVLLPQDIMIGHKVARTLIPEGSKVLRYGAIIGTASARITIGAHIHTHNLESDYLPTYTLADQGRKFVMTH